MCWSSCTVTVCIDNCEQATTTCLSQDMVKVEQEDILVKSEPEQESERDSSFNMDDVDFPKPLSLTDSDMAVVIKILKDGICKALVKKKVLTRGKADVAFKLLSSKKGGSGLEMVAKACLMARVPEHHD